MLPIHEIGKAPAHGTRDRRDRNRLRLTGALTAAVFVLTLILWWMSL